MELDNSLDGVKLGVSFWITNRGSAERVTLKGFNPKRGEAYVLISAELKSIDSARFVKFYQGKYATKTEANEALEQIQRDSKVEEIERLRAEADKLESEL